ncbi:TetR/AcrR family transcriptional regulator [Streptomyces sp900116325]|uniref:TetR/AcrR family transcriptional regulator n=1 Tax=Streptomyces sp. 900116325 TaxID=3154295 RepID=A0ABV2UMG6_9ACTN
MTAKRPPARKRLLETADQLFYAEGVHIVGIDRIIEEAGVAKGSLFYNFSGKDDLVAAYLAARDESHRSRIARHVQGCESATEKLLAIFEALQEVVGSPYYNGCPFANANAEAAPDGVEEQALRTYRGWLGGMFHELAAEAGFADPAAVADRLCLLYDGAIATSQLDKRPDAVRIAKELAATVLDASPRDAS